MEVKIIKTVEDKINWLVNNYPEEISAWLVGEIKDDEILINELLFPYQDVSGGSVEVEGKNLVKLRQEYGNKCKKIIGHWHSHNSMGSFFSADDEEFIEKYMNTKNIAVFIVSSQKSSHRIKLVIRNPINLVIDELDYSVVYKENSKVGKELKKMIKKKVTKRVIPNTFSWGYPGFGYGQTLIQDNVEDDIKMCKEFIKNKLKFNELTNRVGVDNLNLRQAGEIMQIFRKFNPKLIEREINSEVVFYMKSKQEAVLLLRELRAELETIFYNQLEFY